MRPPRHEFLSLDMLRGVAALAVLDFHTGRLFGPVLFPHGYLAVYFFFMLSGFVLAYAYQARLDDGWPTKAFLLQRLVRLFPLYLLGLLLGFAFRLSQIATGAVPLRVGQLAAVLALGVLFLPQPPSQALAGEPGFPLNFPTWSLFQELVANAVHAVLLRRRSSPALGAVAAVSAVLLLAASRKRLSLDFGAYRNETFFAVPRVLLPYVMGMLLLRFWQRYDIAQLPRMFSGKATAIFVAIALIAAFGMRTPVSRTLFYDIGCVVFIFPVLLLLGAVSNPSLRFASVFRSLGMASYAIYVLHEPVAFFFQRIWLRVHGRPVDESAPWSGLLYVMLLVALVFWLDRVYDLPARAWLRRYFSRTG